MHSLNPELYGSHQLICRAYNDIARDTAMSATDVFVTGSNLITKLVQNQFMLAIRQANPLHEPGEELRADDWHVTMGLYAGGAVCALALGACSLRDQDLVQALLETQFTLLACRIAASRPALDALEQYGNIAEQLEEICAATLFKNDYPDAHKPRLIHISRCALGATVQCFIDAHYTAFDPNQTHTGELRRILALARAKEQSS